MTSQLVSSSTSRSETTRATGNDRWPAGTSAWPPSTPTSKTDSRNTANPHTQIFGRSRYYQQFYEPYLHYPAPIFAIPGNHDTDVGVPPNHTALKPFMANFCATKPAHLPDAREVERTTITQPNCYWTLTTPLATIVGLATNAPDQGEVRQEQADWLVGELRDAPRERALLVALHHPPLSADDHHGASVAMQIGRASG